MSNKIFTTVPVPKFPRSTFNLSRPALFTPRMHKEYPTEILEVIPGDGFKIYTEAYAKSMPMVAPVFAKSDICQESFFVPAWQLHEDFDDFITGGERGDYTDKMPFITVGNMFTFVDNAMENDFSVEFPVNDSPASRANVNLYNERLTMIQDILEQMDVMRSIPFVVPDFVPLIQGMSNNACINRAASNYSLFQTANQHCDGSSLRINLLPFAACLKVWCEFYRDENLCDDLYAIHWCGEDALQTDFRKLHGNLDSVLVTLQDTSDPEWYEFLHALFGLKSRAWKKDYFTSALPFVQKGPDVVLPLDAEVSFRGIQGLSQDVTYAQTGVNVDGQLIGRVDSSTAGQIKGRIDNASIGTTIQDVRTAFRLEELYEADSRFGSRYPENMLGQFGVHTPDSRLPRCQFLGSSKQPIQVQQVIQQSATDEVTPQGNLAGLSSSYGSNKLVKTYQSQHGFLICLSAVRVHSLYQQGIHPMFSRYDRTEYAWPRFAHLGEQPIYVKQLYVDEDVVTEDQVFGYTPRYADYKSDTGSIHGKLKGSLNVWTMARRFSSVPQLNEEFIYGRPRQDAFVVDNWLQPCFVMEIDYHVRSNRLLPFYGQPTL